MWVFIYLVSRLRMNVFCEYKFTIHYFALPLFTFTPQYPTYNVTFENINILITKKRKKNNYLLFVYFSVIYSTYGLVTRSYNELNISPFTWEYIRYISVLDKQYRFFWRFPQANKYQFKLYQKILSFSLCNSQMTLNFFRSVKLHKYAQCIAYILFWP